MFVIGIERQARLRCTSCDKWCHRECDGMSIEQYNLLKPTNDDPSVEWYCLYCTLKFHHGNVPFTVCGISELHNINNSDSMEFCDFLPSLEVVRESGSLARYSLPDPDLDLPNLVNSKYHSVDEFQKLDMVGGFNVFHANANGLEGKFETLRAFLAGAGSAMGIVAITETSEDNDNSFLINVSMEGYNLYHTPSLSHPCHLALLCMSIIHLILLRELI